ncbi:MAG: DUF4405 domain-containing protein [Deltaproteobacteria bacterium]|nr:DUF4405 domain-containing protein [Deltaproteobacteria bacterium]
MTKGLRSQKRLARLFVNSLLILAAIPVLATGLAQSKYILSFLDLSGGSALRQTHAVLAYWSLVLIGVHVGLNWSVVWAFIRKKLNINEKRPLIKRFDLLILLLIVIYGVKSFIDRNMLNKLFKGYSYDFWDPERYKIFLFFEYASILIFLVVLTNVLVRLTSNRKTIFSNK